MSNWPALLRAQTVEELERSVGALRADMATRYLPLAGGTMTGNIDMNSGQAALKSVTLVETPGNGDLHLVGVGNAGAVTIGGASTAGGTVTDYLRIPRVGNASFDKNVDMGGYDFIDVGMLNLNDYTELTISSGAITVTQSYHRVDTEGDAATDDLDTINGGTPGDLLFLNSANDGRDVVLKNGTGNLLLGGGADQNLTVVRDVIMLLRGTNSWLQVSFSSNG